MARVVVGTHPPLVCSGVQAPTPEIKAAWVSEIRKVLTSQLQACRGEGLFPGLPRGTFGRSKQPQPLALQAPGGEGRRLRLRSIIQNRQSRSAGFKLQA